MMRDRGWTSESTPSSACRPEPCECECPLSVLSPAAPTLPSTPEISLECCNDYLHLLFLHLVSNSVFRAQDSAALACFSVFQPLHVYIEQWKSFAGQNLQQHCCEEDHLLAVCVTKHRHVHTGKPVLLGVIRNFQEGWWEGDLRGGRPVR